MKRHHVTAMSSLGCCGRPRGSCGASAENTQAPARRGRLTAFEGARLIVGDGAAPIENSRVRRQRRAFRPGRPRGTGAGAGRATRIDLTGKTVMPAIVDTHHAPRRCVRRWSKSCSGGRTTASPRRMSLGQDAGDVPYQVRRRGPFRTRHCSAPQGVASSGPSRAAHGSLLGDNRSRSAQGHAGRRRARWTSSRSGWTIATASTRS